MLRFIDELEAEPELLRRINSRATKYECPEFSDFWWDKVDIDAVFKNPGIVFQTKTRMFVLARINGEIRFFAGDVDSTSEEYSCELGVLDSIRDALNFGSCYLLEDRKFRDIRIKRSVRASMN